MTVNNPVLDNLFRALEAEGNKEIGEILAEAEREAKTIIKGAQAEVSKIKEGHLKKAELFLKRKKNHLVNQAQIDNKEKLQQAKKKIIEQVFESMGKKLKDLRKEKIYPKVFRRLAIEAVKVIPKKMKMTIRVRKDDAEVAEKILGKLPLKNYVLKPNLRGLGGLEISAKTGQILAKNTLKSRLEKARKVLEREVTLVLFGD